MATRNLLEQLLTPRPAVHPGSVPEWWAFYRDTPVASSPEASFDRAVAVAARVERLGWAFASGYQAAVTRLWPDLGHRIGAVAVTEAEGNHPRAIGALLRPAPGEALRLSGHKVMVTLGHHAQVLLVLAAGEGGEGERRDLAVVAVPTDRRGVALEPTARPLPIVPEVPHAAVVLDDVVVHPHERLAGCGWADWVRPFRTVEDLHVVGGLLGMAIGLGVRHRWPRTVVEPVVARLVACRALAAADPAAPGVHVAVGGLLRDVEAALDALAPHVEGLPEEVRIPFTRDRQLLRVAEGARRRRLARAWERLVEVEAG